MVQLSWMDSQMVSVQIVTATCHKYGSAKTNSSNCLLSTCSVTALCFYTAAYWYINPWSTELFNLNFQSLEVVSRYRDTQLQVNENVWHL